MPPQKTKQSNPDTTIDPDVSTSDATRSTTRGVDPKVIEHYELEERAETALLGYAIMDIMSRQVILVEPATSQSGRATRTCRFVQSEWPRQVQSRIRHSPRHLQVSDRPVKSYLEIPDSFYPYVSSSLPPEMDGWMDGWSGWRMDGVDGWWLQNGWSGWTVVGEWWEWMESGCKMVGVVGQWLDSGWRMDGVVGEWMESGCYPSNLPSLTPEMEGWKEKIITQPNQTIKIWSIEQK
ncbi:hypothetical protein V8E55_002574 [Tylopilus felleus]